MPSQKVITALVEEEVIHWGLAQINRERENQRSDKKRKRAKPLTAVQIRIIDNNMALLQSRLNPAKVVADELQKDAIEDSTENLQELRKLHKRQGDALVKMESNLKTATGIAQARCPFLFTDWANKSRCLISPLAQPG